MVVLEMMTCMAITRTSGVLLVLRALCSAGPYRQGEVLRSDTRHSDGEKDTVSCGGGRDTVYFDKGIDSVNAINCEKCIGKQQAKIEPPRAEASSGASAFSCSICNI